MGRSTRPRLYQEKVPWDWPSLVAVLHASNTLSLPAGAARIAVAF